MLFLPIFSLVNTAVGLATAKKLYKEAPIIVKSPETAKTEGSREGYTVAAAIYDKSYENLKAIYASAELYYKSGEEYYKNIKEQYASELNEIDSKNIEPESQYFTSDKFYEKLKKTEVDLNEIEKARESFISDKYNLSKADIDLFWQSPTGFLTSMSPLNIITDVSFAYKMDKLAKAEAEGYVEGFNKATKMFEEKLENLKQNFCKSVQSGNDQLNKLHQLLDIELQKILDLSTKLSRLDFIEQSYKNAKAPNDNTTTVDECNKALTDLSKEVENISKDKAETARCLHMLKNLPAFFDKYDKEFCEKTKLSKTDMAFLFTAIGLQLLRQFLLTKFPERLDDQTAAKNTPGHKEEHSDRNHELYNPTLEQIENNPVPFDANIGANGALSGAGKLGHRAATLGHDPVLGLLFGTANIATSTLTNWKFESFHISTNVHKRDFFNGDANTLVIFNECFEKLMHQGFNGKMIIAVSLLKEIVHLSSDINTKNSLPLPIISVFDPKLASKLAEYGLDMANIETVSKQVALAHFINTIIAMIHRLFYNESLDTSEELYNVRTLKIITYSNIIASSANLGYVALTKDVKKLDIGGIGLAIYNIISNRDYIAKVKREFIEGRIDDLFMNGSKKESEDVDTIPENTENESISDSTTISAPAIIMRDAENKSENAIDTIRPLEIIKQDTENESNN